MPFLFKLYRNKLILPFCCSELKWLEFNLWNITVGILHQRNDGKRVLFSAWCRMKSRLVVESGLVTLRQIGTEMALDQVGPSWPNAAWTGHVDIVLHYRPPQASKCLSSELPFCFLFNIVDGVNNEELELICYTIIFLGGYKTWFDSLNIITWPSCNLILSTSSVFFFTFQFWFSFLTLL